MPNFVVMGEPGNGNVIEANDHFEALAKHAASEYFLSDNPEWKREYERIIAWAKKEGTFEEGNLHVAYYSIKELKRYAIHNKHNTRK